jgi:heparanase
MKIARALLLPALQMAAGVGLLSCTAFGQTIMRPQTMPQIGQVDSRFLSFNVETVEVTGGRFWKPYKPDSGAKLPTDSNAKPDQNQPTGMDAGLFQYRPPINLYNPKVRMLASYLSPAFLRVSGTWRKQHLLSRQ